MKKKLIILHSPMAPADATDALRRSMDEERWKLFSRSGFHGDRDVIGDVYRNSIHLQKRRRFSRNDFAPHVYGSLEPEPGGTKITGHFSTSDFVKAFMLLWLLAAIVIGGAVFAATLHDVLTGKQRLDEDQVGLIAPPIMILFGIGFFTISRLFGQGDETFLLEHLQSVLKASREEASVHAATAIHPS
ncbi:MAG TPA: hypothetical protein VIB39_06290 [Candidatus Angelobacter sp.]